MCRRQSSMHHPGGHKNPEPSLARPGGMGDTRGREVINWGGKDAQRIALAGVLIMGSVKPSYIKNFAMDLLRTYESSFSPDFEQNKLKVSEYTDIKNKTIRNRVAGYISNVMRQRSTRRGEVEIDV